MTKSRHTMAVAAHLLLSDDQDRVLFMRRANTGYGDGMWSVPAGHAEPAETLHQACVRETVEEIGVVLAPEQLRALLVQHKHDDDGEERLDAFFAATMPATEVPVVAEAHLCDALEWRPIDDPPQPLLPYLAAALRSITSDPGAVISYYGFDSSRSRRIPHDTAG